MGVKDVCECGYANKEGYKHCPECKADLTLKKVIRVRQFGHPRPSPLVFSHH